MSENAEYRMEVMKIPALEKEVEHLRVLARTKDNDSKVLRDEVVSSV